MGVQIDSDSYTCFLPLFSSNMEARLVKKKVSTARKFLKEKVGQENIVYY